VRVGNWVEEQFGREAEGNGDTLKEFLRAQEAAHIASQAPPERSRRVEPNLGVPGEVLFSHGPAFSLRFGASMAALHFSDPRSRAYGPLSNDRVHKSFFYGSKHIDAHVPKVNPNPPLELTMRKQSQWARERASVAQASGDMYATTHKVSYKM
jgi:hypothetical protein